MAKILATTYSGLVEAIERSRSIDRAKIANNTVARYGGGDSIIVELHGNPIVRLTPGMVEFTLADHPTVTTRERINQFLPSGFGVVQRQWEQKLSHPDGRMTDMDRLSWYYAPVGG